MRFWSDKTAERYFQQRDLVSAQMRLANAAEKANELKERELKLQEEKMRLLKLLDALDAVDWNVLDLVAKECERLRAENERLREDKKEGSEENLGASSRASNENA